MNRLLLNAQWGGHAAFFLASLNGVRACEGGLHFLWVD